jgi:transposase
LLTAGLFTVNVNVDVFIAWQDLLSKLPPGCVVVMDNTTFHTRADTSYLIRKTGHILEYLPAYSPDLNPIEQKWAQAKAIGWRTQDTRDNLFKFNQFI